MIAHRRLCTVSSVLTCWCLLASCDSQTEVESTVPADNSTDVDPRSIVAVELNNGIAETDVAAVDPKNFVVTGDLTEGAYTGTLVLTRRSKVFKGLTVEQFQANAADAAADPPDDDGKDMKTTKKRSNTIVFLLPTGTRFKDGETIHVSVRSKVTANGAPIRRHRTFSFRVRGGSGATGDLKVVSADPASGSSTAEAKPRMAFTFNRSVKGDNLKDAIFVRGEQSGAHSGGDTLFSRTEGSGRVLSVVRRLAADDAFIPGELVHVALSSDIADAVSSPTSPPQKLQPYVVRFQVAPGQVADGWSLVDPAIAADGPVATLVADFRPGTAGVECVLVGSSGISLLSQSTERVWSRSEISVPLVHEGKTYAVSRAFAFDMDDDGVPEIIVLLEAADASRVACFKVAESGELSATGLATDLPVTGIAALAMADLDGSGKPEIILTHLPGRYTPQAGGAARTTGSVSFLQLQLVPPDPGSIDPTNPDTLKPKPQFQPVHDAIKDLSLAQAIAPVDLNGDGKLDLLVEQQGSLLLYRNIGAPGALLAFRRVGELIGRGGGDLQPLAWCGLDVDADGDQDVLAWDAEGALLHRNRLLASDSEAEPQGLLESTLPPEALPGVPALAARARVVALQIDGVDGMDLVLAPEAGGLSLLLGDATGSVFEPMALGGAEVVQAFALADLDGDAGLDVAALLDSGAARFFLAQQVEPPPVSSPSEFRFATEDSGRTDLSESIIRVGVVADITELFSGYSIALDYDEKVLSYKGFEAPEDFLQVGSFELCPDSRFQGCAGNASATMIYRESTRGAAANDVLLGTFLFQKPTVTSKTTTKLELKGFTGANNTTIENAIKIVDGSATVSIPATIGGEPIDLVLEPPAPPSLTVACEVTSRGDSSLTGKVRWSSPAGIAFSQFVVTIGEQAPVVLPGTSSEHVFTTSLTGSIVVAVTGRDAEGEDTMASCQVVGIHRPTVTCVAVSPTENRVTWTLSHSVERFVIYRNGSRLGQTADGTTTELVDRSPSPVGADDYQIAGVIGGVEGPQGSCAGGPIGDDNTEVTTPPQIIEAILVPRASAADPNTLRCRWVNGEGYSGITLTLSRAGESSPFVTESLEGNRTEFTFAGDAARGGVKPQIYVFGVQGRSGGRASDVVRSTTVSVPVPILAVPLTCPVNALGGVRLGWFPVWRGYAGLKVVTEHRATPEEQPTRDETTVDFDTTELELADLAPIGTYDFRLVASYTDPLPQSLVPGPGALERTCQVTFASRLLVGRVEAGVGMSAVEIPVRAEALGLVSGFHFELEYPSFLTIDPQSGLRVDDPDAEVTQFAIVDGPTPATRKAVVTVSGAALSPDADGDGQADGQIVLARLIGSVPQDFSLGGERPLRFAGSSTMQFAGSDSIPVATDNAGVLVVRRRYVVMDRATVAAGSPETFILRVRGTFDAPATAPNYRLNAFTLHIKYDPALLEALLVTNEDQRQTVVFGRGTYFLPNEVSIANARTTGDLRVSWLGFNLSNPSAPPEFVTPAVNMNLVFLKFRSKVPGNSPARSVTVSFVTADASSDLPTAFHPEVDVPGEPDLEAAFDGGVDITSNAVPFAVQGIAPARGSLLGGNEAVISGSGFLSGGITADDIGVTFVRPAAGGSTVDLPVTQIVSVEATRIRIVVPDSGLRTPSVLSTPADVVVTAPSISRRLTGAYAYEAPRVTSFDLKTGKASGGELMVVSGFGLAPTSTVAFRVQGVAAPVAATVTRVDTDGAKLFLETPNLQGHAGKTATVEVTVPGVSTISAPGTFSIVADGGGTTLRLTSISPTRGTLCGGDEVTLTGEGFLTELSVSFGSFPAAAVLVDSSTRARALTPSFPEGTGRLGVTIANATGPNATLPNAFQVEQLAPPFLRGDITSSGRVDVSDVSILSALVTGEPVTVPPNLDVADVNDDGHLDGGDVTTLLEHLFGSRTTLPPPFTAAGLDPTPDSITSCGL